MPKKKKKKMRSKYGCSVTPRLSTVYSFKYTTETLQLEQLRTG